MMLGLIRRDGGSVRLFGRDPAAGLEALQDVAGFAGWAIFARRDVAGA